MYKIMYCRRVDMYECRWGHEAVQKSEVSQYRTGRGILLLTLH